MSLSTAAFIALAGLLFCWVLGAHSRLLRLKNAIASAYRQMDVQLKRRHDLILTWVDAAIQSLEHEPPALDPLVLACNQARSARDAVRARPTSPDAMTALAAAEGTLDGCLSPLLAVAEAHPEREADQTVQALSEELRSTDNKLGLARQVHNDAVRHYNHAQGQFPALLIARIFAFGPSPMLLPAQEAT